MSYSEWTAPETKMCACGCGLTWDEAVKSAMKSMSINREQAEQIVDSLKPGL